MDQCAYSAVNHNVALGVTVKHPQLVFSIIKTFWPGIGHLG